MFRFTQSIHEVILILLINSSIRILVIISHDSKFVRTHKNSVPEPCILYEYLLCFIKYVLIAEEVREKAQPKS